MAHFAKIDTNNIVSQVIVVHDNDCQIDGVETESAGVEFCQNLFGGNWLQTSYNGNIRKNYAGVGFFYDSTRDAFIPPSPYPSWVIDDVSCQWVAPVAAPSNDSKYYWDEDQLLWVEVTP